MSNSMKTRSVLIISAISVVLFAGCGNTSNEEPPEVVKDESAFYYVRVLEIPTPRWTAYDRVRYNLDLPDEIPLKTQERAYTSPVWYSPK